jgi:hypothetical protein
VQDLGGAADRADLHDGVENFDVAQAHGFNPLRKQSAARADCWKDTAKFTHQP